jgi:protein-arginine deiminase
VFVVTLAVAVPLAVPAAPWSVIFSDGFESGDTAGWTTVVGGSGVPVIDIRADVNRNGSVDLDDPSEDLDEDTWDESHGAIFVANLDDDQSACPTSGTDAALAACHDAADDVINGSDDLLDLARLEVVPWPAAPDDASATISLSSPGSGWVRLFERQGPSFVVHSPGATFDAAALRSGIELAIEATDIVRDSAQWDGFLDVTLVVDAGTGPAGPLPDGSDTVRLRLAPVLFRHHLDGAETVHVSAFSWQGSVDFRNDLATAMVAAGVANPLDEFWGLGDQWTQDFFETAYMSMPAVGGQHVIRINFRSANYDGTLRQAGRVVFTDLRGPDVAGAVQYDPAHSDYMDTLNSFGNLETIPPHEHGGLSFPAGRVVRGGVPAFHPDTSFDLMIDSQGWQEVLYLDTSWLAVGHVDESLSFSSAPNARGWVVLHADAGLGWSMLEDESAAGNGNVPMFVGTSAQVTINQVLGDPDLANANAWAVAEIADQLSSLKAATGLGDDEILAVASTFEDTGYGLLAHVPGMVNGISLTTSAFGPPDPHGPVIDGKDIFKGQLEAVLQPLGVTVSWIEDWELYHTYWGEVHCGSNTSRVVPDTSPWWEGTP